MDVENTQAALPAETQGQAPEQTQEMPQIADLDGMSKWSFQGKEYTPEEWHEIFTGYQTLSKQAKTWEEKSKFESSFEVDLQTVLKDPTRAQEFKAVYPKSYHSILDKLLEKPAPASAQSTPAQPSLPKEFLSEFEQLKERLSFHEKRAYDAEVQAADARLNSVLPPLFKKFEMANEEQVYARAEALLQKGQTLTDKTWERLVRESHEQIQKKADQVYSAKIKKQTEVGQRSADSGPGGAAPGQAPKRRSFDEATEAMIAHVRGAG